jgi:site-specific recombinase XerD
MITKAEIEDFLAERNLSSSTEYSYRLYLRWFAEWLAETGQDPQTVTVRQVKTWIEEHKWGNSCCYQASVSIRLFSIWRFGEMHPLAKLHLKLLDPGPQPALTTLQAEQLLASLETPKVSPIFEATRIRDLAMIRLAMDTGLRASELARLDLDHLSTTERTLSVLAKGPKWRHPVFSARTAAALEAWLKVREKYALPKVQRVFISFRNGMWGQPMTRQGIRDTIHRRGKAASLELTTHDLRRTFATEALRKGASTRLVQVQGGWSDIRLVERYTQSLTPSDFDEHFFV